MSVALALRLFADRVLMQTGVTSPSYLADRLINHELPQSTTSSAEGVLKRIEQALAKVAANSRGIDTGLKSYTTLAHELRKQTAVTSYLPDATRIIANTLPLMPKPEASGRTADLARSILMDRKIALAPSEGFFCAQFALSPEIGDESRAIITFPAQREPRVAYRTLSGPLERFHDLAGFFGANELSPQIRVLLNQTDDLAVKGSRKTNFEDALKSHREQGPTWQQMASRLGKPAF